MESNIPIGLEQVDWASLSHAYGVATDVPELLGKLVSGSEEDANEAIYAFYGNIYHQGTLYSATAPTIPFLIEIACNSACVARHDVVSLLDELARGWLTEQFPNNSLALEDMQPHVAERHRMTLPFYQASHQAVCEGFERLRRLLNDHDLRVRAASIFLFASLDSLRIEVVDTLLQEFHQGDDKTPRAELLIGLMTVAERHPHERFVLAIVRLAESQLDDEGEPASLDLQLAAALCLIALRSERTEELLNRIRPCLAEKADVFTGMPWRDTNDLFSLISYRLEYNVSLLNRWIIDGLEHPDSEIQRSAIYRAESLNARYRNIHVEWVPALDRMLDSSQTVTVEGSVSLLTAIGSRGVEVLKRRAATSNGELLHLIQKALTRVDSIRKEYFSRSKLAMPTLFATIEQLVQEIERLSNEKPYGYFEALRTNIDQLSCHGLGANHLVALVQPFADGKYHPWLSLSAIRCLWTISRDAQLVVPLLIEALRPEVAGFAAIELLREIGPPAAAALPKLRRIIHGNERYIRWVPSNECGVVDEATIALMQDAIRAIDAEKQ